MATSPVAFPGDDITAALVVPPAWTAMAGSYTNSWSDSAGGNTTGQYRLWQLLNSVEVIGVIAHASISGNSAFFTLPAGFRPATTPPPIIGSESSGAVINIGVSTGGVLTALALAAGTTFIQFHGWISLDA